ncbi:MAG: hypothetical protein WBG46_02995 [Nonlabens sp.]
MPDYKENTNNKMLKVVLKQLNLRFPVAEISRSTGEAKGNISSFINNKKPVSDNFIQKVVKSFNLDLSQLERSLEASERNVVTPKNGLTFKEMENGQYTVAVPLIPFEAHAQYLSETDDVHYLEDYEEVTFIVDQVGHGHYKAFSVKGDSMDGGSIMDTADGAIVLARELLRTHWKDGFRSTDYGWIIITQHNILFKDILDYDLEQGIITCHSRNPSPEYSDFELSLDEIHQIFKVIKRTF